MTKYQNLQIQNGGRLPYWKSFMATSQRSIVRLMRNLISGSIIMFDTGRLTKYQISKIRDGGRPPFWKWFYRYILAADHLISMKFDADANFNTNINAWICRITQKVMDGLRYNFQDQYTLGIGPLRFWVPLVLEKAGCVLRLQPHLMSYHLT